MLNYARGLFGYGEQQQGSSTPAASVQHRDVDAGKLARAQDAQLRKLEAKAARLDQQKADAVRARDAALIKSTLQEQRKNAADMNQLRGIMANQRGVQDAVHTAAGQRDTALVMKAGADELETIVKETEVIDTDTIASRLQDAAADSREFGTRLSEPLFGTDDADEIEDEVAALMEAGEVELPDLPERQPVPLPVKSASKVPVKKGTRKAV